MLKKVALYQLQGYFFLVCLMNEFIENYGNKGFI